MIITWNDKKSVFGTGKKSYRFGDTIPAGLLGEFRIEELKKSGKIKVKGEAVVIQKQESVKPVVIPEIKKVEPVKKKSKAEIEEEELERLIAEEDMITEIMSEMPVYSEEG